MKKFLSFVLLLLILGGCDKNKIDKKYYEDTIPPVLQLQSGYSKVIIYENDEIDIFGGLMAIDNLEGNITDKIAVDKGDFDNSVVGEYQLVFYVSDLANNVSNFIYKTIIVRRRFEIIAKYPIFNGIIENEISPETEGCFKGAYYLKVLSAQDYWFGIEAEVTLPMYDINRYEDDYQSNLPADPNYKNMDTPSLYLGGEAQYQTDDGLALMPVILGNKTISKGSLAYRPFWRYTSNKDIDEGPYDLENERRYSVGCTQEGAVKNCYAHWHYLDTEFYYLPGDRVRMIVVVVETGKLQLQIEVLEKSTLEYSVNLRKEHNWKDPENFISPVFSSPGYGFDTKTKFKRVNAIDQLGNEKQDVIPTTTEIFEAVWHNTYLYRKIAGTVYRVPMNQARAAVMECPNSSYIDASNIDEFGGQVVKLNNN